MKTIWHVSILPTSSYRTEFLKCTRLQDDLAAVRYEPRTDDKKRLSSRRIVSLVKESEESKDLKRICCAAVLRHLCMVCNEKIKLWKEKCPTYLTWIKPSGWLGVFQILGVHLDSNWKCAIFQDIPLRLVLLPVADDHQYRSSPQQEKMCSRWHRLWWKNGLYDEEVFKMIEGLNRRDWPIKGIRSFLS